MREWIKVVENSGLPLRRLSKMVGKNNGSRTLFESVMMPEAVAALRDWLAAHAQGVLIGGLALSYYVRPRMTQDIDLLFLSDAAIPSSVTGFKRIRPHAYQHNRTHIEVELVTPSISSMPLDVLAQVIKTAVISDGMKVASPGGLVASKLFRLSAQDRADIIALIKTGQVNLDSFPIPDAQLSTYEQLVQAAATDPHP